MTLFGNNFNEGIKDRQRDGQDKPIKNGFSQLGKVDFWLPGHNQRLQERLRGYNTASTDAARINNISNLIPDINPIQSVTSNNSINVGNVSGRHMSIDQLIEICTNLKNKLKSVHDDFLAIHKDCDTNKQACEDIRSGYSCTIEYLSEQTFIQNSARIFQENQENTDQEIKKLIDLLDDLMTKITNLANQINDVDINQIDVAIKWLESHPER